MTNNGSMFKKLAILAVSLLALFWNPAASADTINSRVFDWTDHGSGTYVIENLGPDTFNGQAGTRYRKTVTQTEHVFDTQPLLPLPANLQYLQSAGEYIRTASVTYLFAYSAKFWNDAGDTLLATGYLKSVNGANYGNEYQFTGGTGAFAGATGWWKSTGSVLQNNAQQWSSVIHLELPSPVPEPETYAMLLAGLGLLAAVARRRIRS